MGKATYEMLFFRLDFYFFLYVFSVREKERVTVSQVMHGKEP